MFWTGIALSPAVPVSAAFLPRPIASIYRRFAELPTQKLAPACSEKKKPARLPRGLLFIGQVRRLPACLSRGIGGQFHRVKLPGFVALDADAEQQQGRLELRIHLGEIVRIFADVFHLLVAALFIILVF